MVILRCDLQRNWRALGSDRQGSHSKLHPGEGTGRSSWYVSFWPMTLTTCSAYLLLLFKIKAWKLFFFFKLFNNKLEATVQPNPTYKLLSGVVQSKLLPFFCSCENKTLLHIACSIQWGLSTYFENGTNKRGGHNKPGCVHLEVVSAHESSKFTVREVHAVLERKSSGSKNRKVIRDRQCWYYGGSAINTLSYGKSCLFLGCCFFFYPD